MPPGSPMLMVGGVRLRLLDWLARVLIGAGLAGYALDLWRLHLEGDPVTDVRPLMWASAVVLLSGLLLQTWRRRQPVVGAVGAWRSMAAVCAQLMVGLFATAVAIDVIIDPKKWSWPWGYVLDAYAAFIVVSMAGLVCCLVTLAVTAMGWRR